MEFHAFSVDGDDTIRITASDFLIEFITAPRCLGARATLEVVD